MNTARLISSCLVGTIVTAGLMGYCSKASADIIHADDVIINGGSLCVGLDGVNGESFGFDTLRLKENNLRIHFLDTSTSASFPSTDWRIRINDSSNGGANYFAIEDSTAGKTPFLVEGNAPTNSLYVEDGGRVGLGTSTPVVELHIKDGDSPTMRLEQDGSSGFTPQTWDVAGNETNFFIRDATNGSKLPFRIRPSAPSNSVFIDTDGDIGMGTSSPDASLHILRNSGSAGLHIEESSAVADDVMFQIEQSNGSASTTDLFTVLDNGRVGIGTLTPTLSQSHGGLHITNSNAGLRLQNSAADGWGYIEYYDEGGTGRFISGYQDSSQTYRAVAGTSLSGTAGIVVTFSGNVGIRNGSPSFPLQVGTTSGAGNGNGAHVTTGGTWTNASSRDFKENIHNISAAEARDAVMNLQPVTYNYKLEPAEQYAGFIAEDVPALVATNSGKYLSPMDIVSVVTKVVQDQQKTIESQQETIGKLNQRLEQLEASSQAMD